MTNIERYDSISEAMRIVYQQKNRAYGDSFIESIHKYGPVAALVRMQDKMNRLDQLLVNNIEQSNEPALDSAMDLANYAIMLAMELNKAVNHD